MLTKTSICLFLLRIVDSRKIRIAIYALIGCLITFTTISVCLFLGVCRPLNAYWDVGVDGVCLSDYQLESVVLAQGSKVNSLLKLALSLTPLVLSIISDLTCAAFPVLFLRNLRIKMRTKVALCVLMGLGVMYDKMSIEATKPALERLQLV